MLRFVYAVLIRVAAPVAFVMMLWRGLGDRAYWDRIGERWGHGARLPRDSLWVHAVSVGEVQAAAPLVRKLIEHHPGTPVVLTTVTPTGAARARALFGDRVELRFVPYDTPRAVRRFFDAIRPVLAVILETELWPNLYAECGRRRVPLVLASARVSPRSVARYRRLVSLFREALSHGIVIGAQSAADAQRFVSIGASAERTHVTGNIKFDFEPASDIVERGRGWRAQNAPGRPVWVAGSTHEGEEEAVLEAHAAVRRAIPETLLVLVPRHPQRFEAVGALLARRGLRHAVRSTRERVDAAAEVLLGDTMGELMTFYAGADVAFVGGSLVPVGGHNLLEPASLGLPILTGPHNFNSEDIAAMFIDAGAARVVGDPAALAAAVVALLRDDGERRRVGAIGQQLLVDNRGSLDRLLQLLEPLIPAGQGADPPAGSRRSGHAWGSTP